MSDAKNYSGGCHCRKVRFDVTGRPRQGLRVQLLDLRQARRTLGLRATGELRAAGWHRVAGRLPVQPEDHHLCCGQCGVGSASQGIAPSGKEMVAVNVRCLDGIDLSALTLTPVDGKKW
jgi:hypothetical protein